MYSRTTMLTYYQVSRLRKIRVRVVKAHEHVAYLDSQNVVDTRKPVQKAGFGSTFFASRYDSQLGEHDRWNRLSEKLKKQLI